MKFNSPHLQSCFESVKPILENIDETKNAVSEDIKTVESYLKSISINEMIDYLATDPTCTINVNLETFCEDAGNGHGLATEERLRWDHISKRLIYIKREYQACVDVHMDYTPVMVDWSTGKILFEKPLIEAPFEMRKRIYEGNHLSGFLSFVADKFSIKNDEKKSQIADDNIPF